MGSSRPHAVTLFPKETCTCPSTTTCYHILACKLSIGIEVKTSPTRWNLTELRRKARRGVAKKSGRKRPRPGDSEVGPAPDASSNLPKKKQLRKIRKEKVQNGKNSVLVDSLTSGGKKEEEEKEVKKENEEVEKKEGEEKKEEKEKEEEDEEEEKEKEDEEKEDEEKEDEEKEDNRTDLDILISLLDQQDSNDVTGNVRNSPLHNQTHNTSDANQQNFPSSDQSENQQHCRERTKRLFNNSAHNLMTSLRKETRKQKTQPITQQTTTTVLDLTHVLDVEPSDPPAAKPVWIQSDTFTLHECEKTIIESGRWLTDDIINSSQLVLAQQFQDKFCEAGFQNSLLGQLLSFTVQQQEFVQVLHDRNHWITISTVGAERSIVLVYDSLYSSAGEDTKTQIASMLMAEEDAIILQFADVQTQNGGNDCGVFALAFATAICLGISPDKVWFDQEKMRNHLIGCLENHKFTMFPLKQGRHRSSRRFKAKEIMPIYCVCRLSAIANVPMIQCGNCKRWFHGKHCIKTPDDAWLSGNKWFCSRCLSAE